MRVKPRYTCLASPLFSELEDRICSKSVDLYVTCTNSYVMRKLHVTTE